jgi:hypothetical protein
VVCIAGDQSWDYQPLAAGTPCQGTGVCDGQGSCVMPPPSQATLAIPSDQLNQQISFIMATSQVWLDASGNSPALISGYHYECTDPPGPLPWYCWIVADIHHSYVRFSDALKNFYLSQTMRNLYDFAFPDIGVHCGFGGICATVNQINADLGDLSLLFGQSSSGAYARLSIPVHSPSSTVIIDSGMPDLELSNMLLSVYVTLTPWVDPSGRPGVRAADVQAVFDFNANFNNFPDWLIELVYDVSEDIRARLRDGVHAAFLDEDRRRALAAALTTGIESYAEQNVPGFNGFASINYISASNGVLYIDYTPN